MSDGMQFVQKSKKDVWITPPKIIDPLQRFYGIDLDPCAGKKANHARRNYRLPAVDGLNADWDAETVFVNPPFSQKEKWLDKAIEEYETGRADRILFLTPDSTDVKSWWHGKIVPNFAFSWFPEGRVNYVDPDNMEVSSGVTFGSALSIMGDVGEAAQYMIDNGDFVCRPQHFDSLDI
jgi:phage N-6-adenine-methyltransferase